MEHHLAWDWFYELMIDTFKQHYMCADCVKKAQCEYWFEACRCYWKGIHNHDEVVQEFRKDCLESSHVYALTMMNEWKRTTVFSHEHGRQAHWLMTGST
jgi:hypothetical protein